MSAISDYIQRTKDVAKALRKEYPDDVIVYHSWGKRQEKAVLSDTKHIIVTTSYPSIDVDMRNVDLVIHYNMPMSLADYYQMASRAGCEGQDARSILLYNPDDYNTNLSLIRDLLYEIEGDKDDKEKMLEQLNEMKRFCEDEKHCMVKSLLQALGDSYDHKCRQCTNCKGRK